MLPSLILALSIAKILKIAPDESLRIEVAQSDAADAPLRTYKGQILQFLSTIDY